MTDIPIPIPFPAGFSLSPDHIALKLGVAALDERIVFEYFEGATFDSESAAHDYLFSAKPAPKPDLGPDPLEITLDNDSVIYVSFYKLLNLNFSNKIPAFNLKRVPGLEYGGIYHYASATHGSPLPIDNCIAARFAVKVNPSIPPVHYHDEVNFNIDFIQPVIIDGILAKARLPVIIDPGVKYPGGKSMCERI